MSYIKREDAKNAIFDYICEQTVSKYPSVAECKAARSGAEGAFNEIDYVPTADVVEVKHGKWVLIEQEDFIYKLCKCSACGAERFFEEDDKLCSFCPNCGAKMDGERKD